MVEEGQMVKQKGGVVTRPPERIRYRGSDGRCHYVSVESPLGQALQEAIRVTKARLDQEDRV